MSRSQPASETFSVVCSGSEAGSYVRLIDYCITQFKAQGPSRTCNASKEEEEELGATSEWPEMAETLPTEEEVAWGLGFRV